MVLEWVNKLGVCDWTRIFFLKLNDNGKRRGVMRFLPCTNYQIIYGIVASFQVGDVINIITGKQR